jgi:hypothetical protein
MSKQVNYRQCRLRRGNQFTTSWLPERFAVVGKVLQWKGLGDWEDGWVVLEAGAALVEEADLPDFHRDRKRYRRNTGDSMPRREGQGT